MGKELPIADLAQPERTGQSRESRRKILFSGRIRHPKHVTPKPIRHIRCPGVRIPKMTTLALAAALLAAAAPTVSAAARPGPAPLARDPFTCPQPEGLFTNPADPTTFYHCTNDVAFLKHCPANLYWSQADQRCEWQEIAEHTAA
ncbi:carbohydrate-binding module family 14 protein [Streptomyces sp. NPDC046853]|uniref:carbohydrate-binding module family 14 protein n=1 Tax=Streptomyces sp. NPDC046853 TaxID=3154920 RepID=UPI0033FE755C